MARREEGREHTSAAKVETECTLVLCNFLERFADDAELAATFQVAPS